jgi:apolipoprotein D and lipocalin family protein
MKSIIFLAFLISSTVMAKPHYPPLDTVKSVEIDRYLGKWYEIARFDQSFQRNCTATEANYSLRKNGDIKVLNRCRLFSPDGKLKESTGRAWVKDKKTNAKLKVQFFLKFLKIGFLSGNYWIIDLDKDYQYAMIGDPSRKYLWILSRSKTLPDETYQKLLEKAEKLKFDTSKLLKTIH